MRLDPRDEALYERYVAVFLARMELRSPEVVAMGAQAYAEAAVREHRALFPLPVLDVARRPSVEPWRFVVSALWTRNFSPEFLARTSPDYPADVLELEIKRLRVAGVLYERTDGTLAIAKEYRAEDPASSMAAIASDLGLKVTAS